MQNSNMQMTNELLNYLNIKCLKHLFRIRTLAYLPIIKRHYDIFKTSLVGTFLLLIMFLPATASAQEVTPTPTNDPVSLELTEEEVTQQVLGVEDLVVDVSNNNLKLEPDTKSPESAVLAPAPYATSLIKNNYQIKEKININVKNLSEEKVVNFDLSIENEKGKSINALVTKDFVNEQLVFTINPEVGVNPGKYNIKVINTTTNNIISSQSFTWGLVSINTNKSIYLSEKSAEKAGFPKEIAKISLGVLNNDGLIVCDANLKLDIKAPWGKVSSFSTEDGTIIKNPECSTHATTNNPDYQVNFPVTNVGRYGLTLTATTDEGERIIKDRFEVRDLVPFEVERISATRLNPGKGYPVKFKIKANIPFRGKIVEAVPEDFQIRAPLRPDFEGQADEGSVISYSNISSLPESFDPFKEFGIGKLTLPFIGQYTQTLGFGQQIDGHGMELVYKSSGIDGHDGIDFSMPQGTPIVAVDDGKVILAKEGWIYGTTIVIQHSWGRTYYGHLNELKVIKGQVVKKGDVIALSGNTGLSTGPHLHFSLKPNTYDVNNLYYGKIDPAPFLGLASVDEDLSHADFPISAKALVWNINVGENSEFILGYDFKAPNRSPYEYSLGQLQFISADITPSYDVAKFDVAPNELPNTATSSADFVLGTATLSAQLSGESGTSGSEQEPKIENNNHDSSFMLHNSNYGQVPSAGSGQVIFEEIRQWQVMADSVSDITVQRNELGVSEKTSVQASPLDFTEFTSLESAFVRNQNSAKLSSKLTAGSEYSSLGLSGSIRLKDPSSILFERQVGSSSAATKFSWESWEYNGVEDGPNEFRVISRNTVTLKSQAGSVKLDNVPADIDKAIPFITGVRSDQKNDLGSASAIAWLSGTDTLNIERGSGGAGDVTVDIVTVEFTGSNWKVYHGDSGEIRGDRGSLKLVDNANGRTPGGSPIGNFEKAIIFNQYRSGLTAINNDTDLLATYAPEGENSVVWKFNQDHDEGLFGRHFVHVLKNNNINVTRFKDEGDKIDSVNLNISKAGLKDIYSSASNISCSVGSASGYGSGIRNGKITSLVNFEHSSMGSAKDLVCEVQIIDMSALRNKLVPALSQTLRHGQWLEGGDKKGFTF